MSTPIMVRLTIDGLPRLSQTLQPGDHINLRWDLGIDYQELDPHTITVVLKEGKVQEVLDLPPWITYRVQDESEGPGPRLFSLDTDATFPEFPESADDED